MDKIRMETLGRIERFPAPWLEGLTNWEFSFNQL